MRVLLLTPPMTQLNTPYPATAYLVGCLRKHAPEVVVTQADPAIDLFLALFSEAGMTRVLAALRARPRQVSASVAHVLAHGDAYASLVGPVVRFLQGRDSSLALRIAGRDFLPEGPRFAALADAGHEEGLDWAFGALGTLDRARHLASLYIDDLADAIRDGIDERFELSRYGEKLAASAARITPLLEAVEGTPTLVDDLLDRITRELLAAHSPDVVGISIPFPGNVYGALRIARTLKANAPRTKIVFGGGYVSTELRDLADPRLFDYCDYVTLDDGERPLLALLDHLQDAAKPLFRCFVRERGEVVWKSDEALRDLRHAETGTPTYDGLALASYVSLFEMLNPMHRLWSDGRWNKLTVARGCYWKKCSFCDISLDYIGRYDPASVDVIIDRIVALVRETGQTGFHFVDEAAPPAALRAIAERLIERRIAITWWGNIRFEKSFTPALAQLLARSGCVAISGGLEVASDRLLKLMQKGVTVAQVARVTRAFSDAGILVHAYLMYGFPTETEQETVDALERVRQLFAEGCIQSGFWHRFAATAHSPIGQKPALYGIRLRKDTTEAGARFARNEVPFVDPIGTDHERLGAGLRKALYNFMHGAGLDEDVRSWFDEPGRKRKRVPATKVAPDFVRRALSGEATPRATG
jgi:radical SAM superfamily enzyme YgiQ (UPF0313 family)